MRFPNFNCRFSEFMAAFVVASSVPVSNMVEDHISDVVTLTLDETSGAYNMLAYLVQHRPVRVIIRIAGICRSEHQMN